MFLTQLSLLDQMSNGRRATPRYSDKCERAVLLPGLHTNCLPGIWPGSHQQERESVVLETRIAKAHHRKPFHAEMVPPSKVKVEGKLRNVIAAVAATLRPSPTIGRPVLGTILLKRTVTLPACRKPPPLLPPNLRRCRLRCGSDWG